MLTINISRKSVIKIINVIAPIIYAISIAYKAYEGITGTMQNNRAHFGMI